MSGSTPVISRVKGGSQVRKKLELDRVTSRELGAERRPGREKKYLCVSMVIKGIQQTLYS